MNDQADNAQAITHPPIPLAIAIAAGIALDRFLPLPWLPRALMTVWLGWMIFILALGLVIWAVARIIQAGSNIPVDQPTIAIVDTGPYRFSRNPIYLGMFAALIGLAIALNTLWLLVLLIPFALFIRYGVVAREEVYLERKFGDVYRAYRSRVRRWV